VLVVDIDAVTGNHHYLTSTSTTAADGGDQSVAGAVLTASLSSSSTRHQQHGQIHITCPPPSVWAAAMSVFVCPFVPCTKFSKNFQCMLLWLGQHCEHFGFV